MESLELLSKAGARFSDANPELEYLQKDIQGAGWPLVLGETLAALGLRELVGHGNG